MSATLPRPCCSPLKDMGWSQASMATRYQHVPAEVLTGIAKQVEGLLWELPDAEDGDDDQGAAGVLVA